jgi:hypothetical protein
MATNIDALVIENFVMRKEEQAAVDKPAAEAYVNQFSLD